MAVPGIPSDPGGPAGQPHRLTIWAGPALGGPALGFPELGGPELGGSVLSGGLWNGIYTVECLSTILCMVIKFYEYQ